MVIMVELIDGGEGSNVQSICIISMIIKLNILYLFIRDTIHQFSILMLEQKKSLGI